MCSIKNNSNKAAVLSGSGRFLAAGLVLGACGLASGQVFGPDLIIQSITPSMNSPAPGQHFTTTITVKNQGNLTAGPFYLLLHSDRATAPTQVCGDYETYAFFDQGLAAGASQSVSVETWYDLCGSHTFWAWADGCEMVQELNEGNNKLSRTISIACPGQPDLVVQSITPSVANPIAGQTFQMTVTVRNSGTAAAGPSMLLVDPDSSATPGIPCQAAQLAAIGSLAVNASTSMSFTVSYQSAGSHTFWARVDGCTQVAESNEGNNRSSRTMQVIAPDLVVQSMSSPPEFLRPGELLSMSATIRNNGTVASAACRVHVFLNRSTPPTQLCSGDLTISLPGIAAGQTRVVAFSVSYTSTGNPRLWVWADACGEVPESSENNNKLSRDLLVRRGPDLIVESITPISNVFFGQWTSVDVVVRNTGDFATPSNQSIVVHAKFDSNDEPSGLCNSFDASRSASGPLAAGARVTLRFTGVAYWIPGLHRFWAKVDPCDDIRESSGSNNTRGQTINVLLF